MKKTLAFLTLFAAGSTVSQAAFISFATGGARGHSFVLSDGATRVTAGSNVRIGYLTSPGNVGTFVEFGTTTINHPLTSQQIGGFINTKTGDNANVAGIRNQQVVVWVYGQNGQQGAFTSPNWLVPNSLAPDVDASFDVILGVTALPGPAVTALAIPNFTEARVNQPITITVGTSSNANGTQYVLGTPIPEPSASLLAGLALLGLARRRR